LYLIYCTALENTDLGVVFPGNRGNSSFFYPKGLGRTISKDLKLQWVGSRMGIASKRQFTRIAAVHA